MKTSKILLNLSAFICFVFGAVYLFTLVFIPIGIYCFIAAKKFAYKADHLFESFAVSNNTLKNYVIFASIACFPLGLLSVIPYFMIVGNKIKVSGFKVVSGDVEVEQKPAEQNTEIKEAEQVEVDESVKEEKVEVKAESIEETEDEKLEKLKKLENFKNKGIITEEEFEMAKEQLKIKK